MRSARTRCLRIEERILRIGLRIKRASQHQKRFPELLAFQPTLRWRQAIPLRPFWTRNLFRPDHDKTVVLPPPKFNPSCLFLRAIAFKETRTDPCAGRLGGAGRNNSIRTCEYKCRAASLPTMPVQRIPGDDFRIRPFLVGLTAIHHHSPYWGATFKNRLHATLSIPRIPSALSTKNLRIDDVGAMVIVSGP